MEDHKALLALFSTAQFVVVLDVNVVNVALPHIQADVGFTQSSLAWVVSAYALAFGSLLLVSGRLNDIFNRRALFSAGLGVFAAGSLLTGLAQTPTALVAGRVVQGIGAAVLSPTGLAVVTATFAGHARRTSAIALWSAAASLGAASGQVVGGIVISVLSWRLAFLINVPLCVVAALMVLRVPLPRAAERGEHARLDWAGATLVVAALVALALALNSIGQSGLTAPASLVGVVLAVALAGAFRRVEKRQTSPLFPPGILALAPVRVGNIATAVAAGATTAAGYFSTLYLQQVLGWSSAKTGIAFLPFTLSVIGSALVAPRVARRFTARWSLLAGLSAMAGSAFLYLELPATGGYLGIVLPSLVIRGAGLGLVSVVATGLATEPAGRRLEGSTAGVLTTSQQLGTAILVMVLTALAAAAGSGSHGGQVVGFRVAQAVSGAILASTAVAAMLLLSSHCPSPGFDAGHRVQRRHA